MPKLPKVTRNYLNHHLDSSRWDVYEPQDSDIIVTTSYKCGTTFTQQILYNVLVRNTYEDEHFPPLDEIAPWIDARFMPISKKDLGEFIKTRQHRRFLKSHLPLDGLPYYEQVKYIIVGRDPRDVFMSLVNHYGAYTDFFFDRIEHDGERSMPRYNGDIRSLWRSWITRGWFDWEQEGYPFWSNMHHTQTYWNFKHLPNFMFLHYSDMLSDLPGTVTRIAEFIGQTMSEEQVTDVVRAVSFDRIKEQAVAESAAPSDMPAAFEGGQATFINKGTNNRWRNVLTSEDIAMYEATRDRVLSPDCAAWLEQGETAFRSSS